MTEEYYENLLNIKTSGNEYFDDSPFHCNGYEPTSYKVLNSLFEEYKIDKTDYVIDFGCGKGRLNFYINYMFENTVTGIEMHNSLYEEAIANKENCINKYKDKISFDNCYAEEYEITRYDNKFYFFNPFSVQIFIKIVHNILNSVEESYREVDIVLYYPSDDYIYYLDNSTTFELVHDVRIEGSYEYDNRERFLVYRLSYDI